MNKYDISFSYHGNGITIKKRNEDTAVVVAYIDRDCHVEIFDKNMPDEVKQRIERIAKMNTPESMRLPPSPISVYVTPTLKHFIDNSLSESSYICVYNKYYNFLAEGNSQELRQNGFWRLLDEENAKVETVYSGISENGKQAMCIVLNNVPLKDRSMTSLQADLTELYQINDFSHIEDDNLRRERMRFYNERVACLKEHIKTAETINKLRTEAAKIGSLWYVNEETGRICNVSFNPDSDAGGTILENVMYFDELLEIAKDATNDFNVVVVDDFYDIFAERCSQTNTDIGTPEFAALLEQLKSDIENKTYTFRDETEETMEGIIEISEKVMLEAKKETKYTVKYCKTEHDQEMDESQIEDIVTDKDEAVKIAKRLFYNGNYARVKVLTEDNKVVFGCDGEGEWSEIDYDIDELRTEAEKIGSLWYVDEKTGRICNVCFNPDSNACGAFQESVVYAENLISLANRIIINDFNKAVTDEFYYAFRLFSKQTNTNNATSEFMALLNQLKSDVENKTYTFRGDTEETIKGLIEISKKITAAEETPKYTVKYWETEYHRDMGESQISDIVEDKDEAVRIAKKLFDKGHCASVEVLTEDNEVVYGRDGNSEWSDIDVTDNITKLRAEAEKIGSLWYVNEETGDIRNVWFNPDSEAGGTFVESSVKADVLTDVMEEPIKDFGDPISEYFTIFYDSITNGTEIKTDINSPEFEKILNELKTDIADKNYAFIGDTEETFMGIIEIAKKHTAIQEAEKVDNLWYVNEDTGQIRNVLFIPDSDTGGTLLESKMYADDLISLVNNFGVDVEDLRDTFDANSSQTEAYIGTPKFTALLEQSKNDMEKGNYFCDNDEPESMSAIMDIAKKIAAKPLPVYMKSVSYAKQNGEVLQYHKSSQVNTDCAAAIDAAISDNTKYGKMAGTSWIDTNKAFNSVVGIYGARRVYVVTAMCIDVINHDGRISNKNKSWASEINTPDVEWKPYLKAHATVIDSFADSAREAYARARNAFFEEKGHCNLSEIYEFVEKDIARTAAHERGDPNFEFSDEIGKLVTKYRNREEIKAIAERVTDILDNHATPPFGYTEGVEGMENKKQFGEKVYKDFLEGDTNFCYYELDRLKLDYPDNKIITAEADKLIIALDRVRKITQSKPPETAQEINQIQTEENQMENTKITARVTPIEDGTKLKGLATVSINDQISIHGVKVVDGKDGLFVSMPGEMGKNKFNATVLPANPEAHEKIKTAVMEAYNHAKVHGNSVTAEKSPTPINIKVSGFKDNPYKNNILCGCQVTVDGVAVIKNVKVVATKEAGELSIVLPKKQDGYGVDVSVVTPSSPEAFAQIKEAVLEGFEQHKKSIIGNTPYNELGNDSKDLTHKIYNTDFVKDFVSKQLEEDGVKWSGKIEGNKTRVVVNNADEEKLASAVEKAKTAGQAAKEAMQTKTEDKPDNTQTQPSKRRK